MRGQEDQQSRVFCELSALVFNLLRSPPLMPESPARRSPAGAQITPAGFASLLLGISVALMLCGSVTFFIGFMLMPWVLGLVMVFYVAAVVSALSVLGRSIICFASPRKDLPDMFLALDKDTNGTLSKQELREYADGTLTDIFIERVYDEHIRHGKSGGGNAREMDFESFLDFVLALENKDTPEGLTYLFRCLDLQGRGYLTTADIHSLFRDVHHKWIEGGNYELCIEDVRDEIWDMVKPVDPLKITLADLLACKQGGTVASMLIDVRGFWAHDNRENLLQEEEEPEEE